jgi:ribosomal-protein-alanine N-acetyltransferase
MFELFSDPRVVEYYDLEPMREISEANHIVDLFQARFESSSGIRWAIREAGRERLIGTIGFNTWSPKMRSGTIGYDLKSSVWGNGYATEAVQSVVRAAFSGQLACGSLHRIQADTVVGNLASEKVLNKCGFREEGIRRDAIYIHGSYRDMKCFGLIAC